MEQINYSEQWRELVFHAKQIQLQSNEISRLNQARHDYKVNLGGIEIDYSNQLINQQTLLLLRQLAKKRKIGQFISDFFSGSKVNVTEQRAALHTALRSPSLFSQHYAHINLSQLIEKSLEKIKSISHDIQNYQFNNIEIKSVINIGIGGSDLGPKMVVEALMPYKANGIDMHFVSNIDPYAIHSALKQCSKEHTLIIISSKSFTTHETLYNGKIALEWLGKNRIKSQCIAITAAADKAIQMGIVAQNVLPLWEWVGGRYSIWSAIGLPIAIAYGYDAFISFLEGGQAIDELALNPCYQTNPLVDMALIDCWNINFLGGSSRAVIPYAEALNSFVPYIQQLVMESNGKSVDISGKDISYHTGPIIWGGIGCNSQHAFHQLLMQGTQKIAVDFIKVNQPVNHKWQTQQKLLNQQLDGQSRALSQGDHDNTAHKKIKGDCPHTIISLQKLDAKSLGSLIALYEYRTIFSAVLWNINPFDQFGVELGKRLSRQSQYDETTREMA